MLKYASLTLSRGYNIEKERGGRNVKNRDWKTLWWKNTLLWSKNSLLFFLQILKACLFDTSLAKYVLSFEFYSKAVFFECKFRISRSAIVQVQNWPIGLQRVGSRIRWRQRLTSLKLQRVNAAHCTCKTHVYQSESSRLPCCILI